MATVHDVAAYILQRHGPITTWKLQKLVYYCQAWHLVWQDEPLFRERIEAWANGPVVPELYKKHRGQYTVRSWNQGDPGRLRESQRTAIDVVLDFYGDKSGHWLSELTHAEPPWRNARAGLSATERGHNQIPLGDIAEYYGGLVATSE